MVTINSCDIQDASYNLCAWVQNYSFIRIISFALPAKKTYPSDANKALALATIFVTLKPYSSNTFSPGADSPN